jgi:putative ABC transport system permease protein
MSSSTKWLTDFLANPINPIGVIVCALVVLIALNYWEYTRFIFKSLRRNMLRSVLTGLATAVLVLVVTLIWSVLSFIDRQTEAKSKNLKLIISEKYQLPSQMPMAYYDRIATGGYEKEGDYQVDPKKDAMYWAFFGGTIDPEHRTRENTVFFFAMEPRKLLSIDPKTGQYLTMMEDIDQVPDDLKKQLAAACQKMDEDPRYVLVGASRLAAMNKKVGETIKVTSFNYSGIELEFEILGELPPGRYEQSAVMNYKYLENALDTYQQKNKTKHPMADKTLALVWLRVPDMATFEKVSHQLTQKPLGDTSIKCETASSGIASFLATFQTILWGMRWLLVPAILATMTLVIANAISISVRERRVEMAILKVLGFSPNQILLLVLAEALLIGCGCGLVSALLARHLVNDILGGVSLPIAFFGKFFIESAAPWWGLGIGALTAFAGSIAPAWSARSVRVTDVFSKIA